MTHKEAIKNLTELQIRLINDNSEEATEYNKKIYETFAYFITQTIPLSVIEKIKAEIERESDYKPYEMYDMKWAFNKALGIIDKAVKEIEKDANM